MNAIPEGMHVISKGQVATALRNKERSVVGIIERAYIAHANNKTVVPHSLFLRFPALPKNRIIALPAYMQSSQNELAGIKWVASFPDNIEQGIDRASATLILNSMQTGRPYCFMEASLINLHRTAASAALAARMLHNGNDGTITLIGCGPINHMIVRYIHATSKLRTVHLYDPSTERAAQLAHEIEAETGSRATVHRDLQTAIQASTLVSFATNTATPFVHDISTFSKGSTVLHISLRDLDPEVIAASTNVVDDVDHVNREATSIHLASQKYGTTDFITTTIGQLAQTPNMIQNTVNDLTIFSPFGLGILDIALGQYVYQQVSENHKGTVISEFFKD